MLNSKWKKLGVIIGIFIIGVISLKEVLLNFSKEDTNNSLINISTLSKTFMNQYLEEIEKLTKEEKENLLIVISSHKLENTYDAKKIIEAPNHQYYLVYNSKEAKANAYQELKKDETLTVEQNQVHELASTSYKSWAVQKLGFDTAIDFVNSQNLPEVRIAILDSGIDTDLFNQNYPGKLKETYNAVEFGKDIKDKDGHGTHLAGIVAESTPNNVKIVAIKVNEEEGIYETDIVKAINYVVYNQLADVINISSTVEDPADAEFQAIQAARQENIITVTAAGNEQGYQKVYPAAQDNTIAVSSVDENLERSSFSNYGDYITFAAPGNNISSIYGNGAGTSMSAPYVSSAVAILKSFNKDLTLENVIDLLKIYAIDKGDDGWDKYYGYGIVSFLNASFCEKGKESECEPFHVFSKKAVTIQNITVDQVLTTEYNYGSINNLFPTKIKITYEDGRSITKNLGHLEDFEITGYDPYKQETQTVTLKYAGFTTTFEVTNSNFNGMGWKYNIINENQIELTSYKGNNQNYRYLYFPETIENKPVVALADKTNPDFFGNTSDIRYVKKVVLPPSLSKIGNNVFAVNPSTGEDPATMLETVLTENAKIAVGNKAFFNNSALTKLEGTITRVGSQAFQGCSSLTGLTLSDEITKIERRAFANCTRLENINLPKKLTTIEEEAFLRSGVRELTIPETVTSIAARTFFGCTFLEEIEIPKSVTIIEPSAFYRNNNNVFLDTIIYTYKNAYAKTFASQNKMNYETIDPYPITVEEEKNEYVAFETVDKEKMEVTITLERGYTQDGSYQEDEYTEIIEDYQITYPSGADSFRYGDDFFIVEIQYHNITYEQEIPVTVTKAIPKYEIPTDLTGLIDEPLKDIILPINFVWENEEETLKEGTHNYKAKYVPADQNNYETIEHIDIPVEALTRKKIKITPEIIIQDLIYNNTTNIDPDAITITNLDKEEYEIIRASTTTTQVGDTTAKITIRLTDHKFYSATLDNDEQENEYQVAVKIIPLTLEKPTKVEKTYTYNEEEQTLELNGIQSDKMEVTNHKRTNAGSQEVRVTLKDKKNTTWSDHTTEDVIFDFTIEKAPSNIQYTSHSQTFIEDGKPHGIFLEVTSPENALIRYMDEEGSYTQEQMPMYTKEGVYVIKFRIFLDENHTDVIKEETLTIGKPFSAFDYEGIYDGEEHTITIPEMENCEIAYSTNNQDFNLKEAPKFREIGKYTIYYQITCPNQIIQDHRNVKIYGIKEFQSPLKLKNDIIITKNNDFNKLTTRISYYASSITFSLVAPTENSKKDIIATGDKISIRLNDSKDFDYKIALLGDINEDGTITDEDAIKVRNHIMEEEIIKETVHFYAADISEDDQITSKDYVKIRKHIMGIELIKE